MKINSKDFSWVQTHVELADYLRTKEDAQHELIEMLEQLGITPLNDQATEGQYDIKLGEIDPFTFFSYIYKYGSERRLQFLQEIAKRLNIHFPEGESGIPSAQAQRVWLFPFKYRRTQNEIPRLWNFFKKALDGDVTNDDFDDIIKIRNTGKTKITESLFYIRPTEYLPINGPIKPYLKKVLNISPEFETFSEYLNILNEVKKKSDLPFYELSYEAWKWNQENGRVNYWIFQGNPKVFDFEKVLRKNTLNEWSVSAHRDKIKAGDKVILWIVGKEAGCYALAEVTEEPYLATASNQDPNWKAEDPAEYKAGLNVTHNLVDSPITQDVVKQHSALQNLKVGNQGTNFSATKKEYETLLALAKKTPGKQYWLYAPGENAQKWDEFYASGIMGLGWDEIGDLKQYKSRNEINSALIEQYGGEGIKKNDATANDDFLNKIQVGDIVIAKKGRKEVIGYGEVTSDYYYDEKRSDFQKLRNIEWKLKGKWKLDHSLPIKTLTDITSYPTESPDYHMYYERLLGIMGKHEHSSQIDYPLNTIFYGPPGTGKTYHTVLRAAEIVAGHKIDDYAEAQRIFNENLHGSIEFITFHQNYSYEDFIQGLRPDVENEHQLIFGRQDGIFKEISDRALKNLRESEAPKLAKQPFDAVFQAFFGDLIEGEVEELEIKMKRVSFFITGISNRSIEFRKSTGGTQHTLSIGTLKKMYEAESALDIQGLGVYYNPLLEELLKIGRDPSGKTEQVKRQNYVLIIDEINRANISRVFGELITLIEPDKRSHGEMPLKVKLPSGDSFSVPSNLYLIGTMNTADKSIALLDIALRRRFVFEPMYPRYDIDGHAIHDVDVLRKINEQIVKTKGHDFQIGHAYFMGRNNDLLHRMNHKVIPLLLEYYMNDEKEVKGILQQAGLDVEENSWPLRIRGKHD